MSLPNFCSHHPFTQYQGFLSSPLLTAKTKSPTAASFFPLMLPLLLLQWGSYDGV